ncbi:tetratricopeptide repeat protein [Pelagicoccus sp. SDUM812002]|nr:tetratricopeptide repeat protein [Pelagicoccus sp. SDUM812002]
MAAELAKDPASVLPQLRLGEAYLRAGETEKGQAVLAEAYRALEVLAAANPKSGRVHYALGLCSLFRGDRDAAELGFQKALELAPDLELASLGLAKIYAEEGSFYRATATIRKALEQSPKNEALRRTLAGLLASNGKTEPAVELYRSLVEEFSDNTEYAESLVSLYLKMGDIEGATPLLDQMMEAGTISEIDRVLRLLEAHLEVGALKEVPRLLQRVRRAEPEHPMLDDYFARYYHLLGEQSARENDWSRATLYFNRSLEYSPDDTSTRQALGSAYLAVEDFEAANEQFMSILESYPSDPQYYADLARTQLGLGNPELAFQVIDKAYESSKARGDLEAMSLFEQTRSDLANTAKRQLQEARSN